MSVSLLALTGCAGSSSAVAPAPAGAAASGGYHGPEPEPTPPARPSFVLHDTDGNVFDFAWQTGGKPTLLYLGYTNCPDECPTAMADIAAALRQTPAALREQTQVVLVGTDAERDTPAAVRRFLDQFGHDFIGLVGTQAEVDAAQRAVGVDPASKEGPVPTLPGSPDEHEHAPGTAPHEHAGPLGYGVGHANVIFAYSSADVLPVVYPGGCPPGDIAADQPRLASGR